MLDSRVVILAQCVITKSETNVLGLAPWFYLQSDLSVVCIASNF